MRKLLTCFTLSLVVSIGCVAQSDIKLDYTIASWLNNKTAAVTLTFDDGIPGQYKVALPLLMQHGFKSTFFVTVKTINDQLKSWNLVNKAAMAGNEIANHSLTHPHFKNLAIDSVINQCVEADKLIKTYVPSQKVITHAYPFGDGGGNTDNDKQIRLAVSRIYIGARATQNQPYAFNKYDFAKSNDDYFNVNSAMIADSASMHDFGKYIDETIAAGGWFCPTYHGVANGWIITPESVFKNHLEELEKRKASLWIAPFKNVVQYHKERNSAKLTAIKIQKKVWKLSLSDTLSDNQNFDQPLTINLNVSGRQVMRILQKGRSLAFQMNKQQVVFNAVPGDDHITIMF